MRQSVGHAYLPGDRCGTEILRPMSICRRVHRRRSASAMRLYCEVEVASVPLADAGMGELSLAGGDDDWSSGLPLGSNVWTLVPRIGTILAIPVAILAAASGTGGLPAIRGRRVVDWRRRCISVDWTGIIGWCRRRIIIRGRIIRWRWVVAVRRRIYGIRRIVVGAVVEV
jgi:hypothetical protein